MENVNPNEQLVGFMGSLVEQKVREVLSPYLPTLDRMVVAFGGVGSGNGGQHWIPSATTAEATTTPPKRRGRPPKNAAKAANSNGHAKFAVGQKVKYRQGRGEFDAKVLKLDETAGIAVIQRDTDGKQIQRPFAKIYS